MSALALTTTVSTKGQVILPKAVRDRLNWEAGARLSVEHTADGVLLRLLTTPFAPTRADDVFNCLPHDGAPKSIEQMNAAIGVEVRNRHARGRC